MGGGGGGGGIGRIGRRWVDREAGGAWGDPSCEREKWIWGKVWEVGVGKLVVAREVAGEDEDGVEHVGIGEGVGVLVVVGVCAMITAIIIMMIISIIVIICSSSLQQPFLLGGGPVI